MTGIVWLVAGGIAVGVYLQPFVRAGVLFVGIPLAIVGIYVRRHLVISMLATFALAASAGWWAAALHVQDGAGLRAAAERFPRCHLTGRVLEHHGGLGTAVEVAVSDCDAPPGTVMTSTLDLPAGEVIDVYGWLSPLGTEDFDQARARTGADAEFIVDSLHAYGVSGRAHEAAARFRSSLRASADHLHPDRQGLILGMTIGDTTQLPKDLEEELRRAGLTHLLAVSGSNVAIVLGVVTLALRRSALAFRIACAGTALALYILIVGPEPSVLRAGAMGAIALLALWRGAHPQTLNLLALALIVVMLLRPGIVYSPGLHLSAAATAGIVVWAESLASRFDRLPRPLALALGATVAAQFAVSPVLLATFGEFSIVAPVANVLAFPVVAPITILGLGAGLLALVWEAPASLVMSGLGPLAGWVADVGRGAGGLTWASVEMPKAWAWPAAALVLVCGYRTLREERAQPDTRPRDDAPMGEWLWKLLDTDGKELRATETFGSKEEAEAWLGGTWQELSEEGADSVALMQGEKTAYTMSLQEG